jgi:hypothetical protein
MSSLLKDMVKFRHDEKRGESGSWVPHQTHVVGNKVIDQEIVTRTFPEGTGHIDVIAIYEVEDGKIAKAWFIWGSPTLDAKP